MAYKLGSLFDGSCGFPLAGALCGIEPRWASEVEPYPIAVTCSRFPYMKHLGDISKINGAEIEPVDIITFGSPCQDLSVAGKRAGLKHEANGDEETTRSGLFMEAVRIIKEMREATNGEHPRFALWENVPGAFSSNKGEDFRIVCEELIKIVEPSAFMPEVPKNGWNYADSYIGDGWSLAYRVFDAQYWGVPQRRRRIHLVADFRGQSAREVLFEREGLRGYFAEGRAPWQAAPTDAERSTGADDSKGESNGGLLIPSDPGYSDGLIGGRGLDELILDDQGGQQIAVRTDGKAPTLRAETHGNLPCVMESAGFCTEHSAKSRGIGYQGEVAPTLRAGVTPGCVYSVENHPADSRVDIDESGKVQTLTSRMGTGGGNVPMVMEQKVFRKGTRPHSTDEAQKWEDAEVANTLNTFDQGEARANELVVEPVVCLQGNGIDRADTAGCNGKGWKEDTCYTLNTIDRPAVAYGLTTKGNGGAFLAEERHTALSTGGGQAGQGYPATVYSLDRASFNQGGNAKYNFEISDSGVNSTLVAKGPSAVAYTINHQGGNVEQIMEEKVGTLTASMNSSGNNKLSVAYGTDVGWLNSCEDQSPTLLARQYKDPHLVTYRENKIQYIVRRLTPTECARLQGFADRWGDIATKDSFTDEEYRFWLEVRNTHAAINGKAVKDYTPKQMLTWYNKLQTDSAEYKMWGNGIALPPALYCMQGITDALGTEEEDADAWML